MEIFGINFNEFEMVKGSLGDREGTDLPLLGTGVWFWFYLLKLGNFLRLSDKNPIKLEN